MLMLFVLCSCENVRRRLSSPLCYPFRASLPAFGGNKRQTNERLCRASPSPRTQAPRSPFHRRSWTSCATSRCGRHCPGNGSPWTGTSTSALPRGGTWRTFPCPPALPTGAESGEIFLYFFPPLVCGLSDLCLDLSLFWRARSLVLAFTLPAVVTIRFSERVCPDIIVVP